MKLEEDVRFELTTPCGALVFGTSAFSRSANLPKKWRRIVESNGVNPFELSLLSRQVGTIACYSP